MNNFNFSTAVNMNVVTIHPDDIELTARGNYPARITINGENAIRETSSAAAKGSSVDIEAVYISTRFVGLVVRTPDSMLRG